jgi:small neutral amino acid transporter SnatA (MarC family)
VVGYVTVSTDYTPKGHFLFFTGAIATVFLTDLSKVYVANRITDYLNARIIGLIDKIAGLGLMAFGVRLIVYAIYGF